MKSKNGNTNFLKAAGIGGAIFLYSLFPKNNADATETGTFTTEDIGKDTTELVADLTTSQILEGYDAQFKEAGFEEKLKGLEAEKQDLLKSPVLDSLTEAIKGYNSQKKEINQKAINKIVSIERAIDILETQTAKTGKYRYRKEGINAFRNLANVMGYEIQPSDLPYQRKKGSADRKVALKLSNKYHLTNPPQDVPGPQVAAGLCNESRKEIVKTNNDAGSEIKTLEAEITYTDIAYKKAEMELAKSRASEYRRIDLAKAEVKAEAAEFLFDAYKEQNKRKGDRKAALELITRAEGSAIEANQLTDGENYGKLVAKMSRAKVRLENKLGKKASPETAYFDSTAADTSKTAAADSTEADTSRFELSDVTSTKADSLNINFSRIVGKPLAKLIGKYNHGKWKRTKSNGLKGEKSANSATGGVEANIPFKEGKFGVVGSVEKTRYVHDLEIMGNTVSETDKDVLEAMVGLVGSKQFGNFVLDYMVHGGYKNTDHVFTSKSNGNEYKVGMSHVENGGVLRLSILSKNGKYKGDIGFKISTNREIDHKIDNGAEIFEVPAEDYRRIVQLSYGSGIKVNDVSLNLEPKVKTVKGTDRDGLVNEMYVETGARAAVSFKDNFMADFEVAGKKGKGLSGNLADNYDVSSGFLFPIGKLPLMGYVTGEKTRTNQETSLDRTNDQNYSLTFNLIISDPVNAVKSMISDYKKAKADRIQFKAE